MLEMLLNPRKAERAPWEMFFVGMFYATLAILLVHWIFSSDAVLSKYSGILVVTFTVMFSMPFVYYSIKMEEQRISETKGTIALLKEHRNSIYCFMFIFLGFVVAFSFWYIDPLNLMPKPTENFRAQIETYCLINRPSSFADCVKQYGVKDSVAATGLVTGSEKLLMIFSNNIYVLIFTLIFSLIFGAGVMFVLAWNASVIAAAIGIFIRSDIYSLPVGLARYLIHGIPEIASYFIVALAGGIISVAMIKHEAGTDRFWDILHDSINLIILAVIILFIAALIEVFVTPLFFS